MTATVERLYPTTAVFPASIPLGVTDALGVVVNDLTLSGVDEFGCIWRVFTIDGWDGSPASSVQVIQKPRGSGGWPSVSTLQPRTPSITGRVEAPTNDLLQDAFDRLNAAVTLTDFVMTVRRGSRVRSAIARREGEVQSSDQNGISFDYTVNLLGLDPRKFATAVDVSTGLPFVTGGITVPTVVPTIVVSSGVSGDVSLTNPGNAAGAVSIRVDGPVTGPKITHVTSGLQITLDPSLILAAGEFLVIDMEAQTVLANGQVSRNAYLDYSSTNFGWSGFLPGVNSWHVDAVSYTTGALFTFTAIPAWL